MIDVKELCPCKVLVYSDMPQLFLAKDQIECLYLCLAVSDDIEPIEYLAVSISSQRLNSLISGATDLREAFKSPEDGLWYKLKACREETLTASELDNVPERYLPDEGFILKNFVTGRELEYKHKQ